MIQKSLKLGNFIKIGTAGIFSLLFVSGIILFIWKEVIAVSQTFLILEIKPVPEIITGPIVRITPPEKISPPEIIPPEKIVEAPKEVPFPLPVFGPFPVIEWPIYGAIDAIVGISGFVPFSASFLAKTIPELPWTTDRTPTIKGKTSLPGATIFIELTSSLITGQTQADEEGNWLWQTPELLSFGIHTIKFTAQDPENPLIRKTGSQRFKVVSREEVEKIRKSLFDLILTIKSEYKEVFPGDDLLVKVEIVNPQPKEEINILLHYQIRDEKDKIVLDHKETMAIKTQLSFFKTFQITEEARLGRYRIFLEIPYNHTFVSSLDTFEIVKRPLFIVPGVIITLKEIITSFKWFFTILILLLIIFLIALYKEYRRAKMTKKNNFPDFL